MLGVADAYLNPLTGARMVQDYRVCKAACLDANGKPKDMTNAVTGRPTRCPTAAQAPVLAPCSCK